MLVVMKQVLLLVLFAAIGYILCKSGKVDHTHTKMLSALQVYVFLPCNIINTYSANFTVAYIQKHYSLLLVSLVIIVLTIALGFGVAPMLAKKSYLRSVYRYSLTVSNYGFFGYPLVKALFGDLMLQNAMVFSLPISLYTYSLGYVELTNTKFSLKRFVNPVIIASIVGAVIGLTGFSLPSVLTEALSTSASCMAPVGMLLAGMVVSEFDFLSLLKVKKNYIVAALRLLVIPCAIVLALKALRLQDAVIPALMMYAMPCGLNTIVFPRLMGEDCSTGASLTLITSLLACVTVPILVALFL